MLGQKPLLKPLAKWALLASVASFVFGAALEQQLDSPGSQRLETQSPASKIDAGVRCASPSAERWRACVARIGYDSSRTSQLRYALMLSRQVKEPDLRLFAEAATLRALGNYHASRLLWLELERKPDSFFSHTEALKPCIRGYVQEVAFECLSEDYTAKRWKEVAPIAHDLVERLRFDCAHEESGLRPWVELASACEYQAYASFHLQDNETAFQRFVEAASLRDMQNDGGIYSMYAQTDRFNAAAIAQIRGFRASDEKLLLQCLHEATDELTTAVCNARLGKMYLQTHRPAAAVKYLKLSAKFFRKYPSAGMICGGGMPIGFGEPGGPPDFMNAVQELMNGSSRIDASEFVSDVPNDTQVEQWLREATQAARVKK